eukprot:1775743-Amphidinium_carterae.1
MTCLKSALDFLKSVNIRVAKATIGTTTERQASRKSNDARWNEDVKRHALLCSLVKDEQLEPVVIDNTSYSTSYKLAVRHSSAQLPPIYVMGSDVQRRPSLNTLIVARAEDKFVAGFNPDTLAGVCVEQQSTHLSSTLMRAMLMQGLIHPSYGRESVQLFTQWDPTLRIATQQEEAAFRQEEQRQHQRQPADAAVPIQVTPGGTRGVTWTPAELQMVYGKGYKMMEKM